ncbi:MAG: DUF3768 domain-containing protein [Pelagimonas sp.]|uniref:DUF3768 domain-containing protein n=1 Tax=Pelagimonas sp. TaxID=2073170 RepID=UPI003D6BE2B2
MTVEYCSVVSEVAKQNDIFRQAILDPEAAIQVARQGIIGQIVLTPGVAEEAEGFRQAVLAAVAQFDTFTEDNDPYGDHTFGAFEVAGEKLFWKIDLYDTAYHYGSEDPANPTATRRALTIMLRSEY